MRTTIKQQMAAVKKAMKLRVEKVQSNLTHYHYQNDGQWLALNDAYSSLASIALVNSLRENVSKQYISSTEHCKITVRSK